MELRKLATGTPQNRNVWIDYLRSFLTVLVVAHHSSLAYTTFANFDTKTYINSTNPIVDNSRWIGMDIFENFNDIFFMPLMFFISGLFVYHGIIKKGGKIFLTDRLKRLGIPFIVGVTIIIPIAYLPSFYLSNNSFNISLFIKDYLFNQQFPVGPPWFIWVLLFFNAVAVIIPSKIYVSLSKSITQISKYPARLFIVFFVVVALAFTPISLWVGQYKWTGFGPFDFQLNRVFLYFTFFIFGTCIGSGDWENYFFTNNKFLNKSWQFWLILCLFAYLLVELFTYNVWDIVRAGKLGVNSAWLIFDLIFVASCISSSFAFLSIFKQNIQKGNSLWTNLSSNAFGIYLLHYIFITWLQFALLNVSLPVFIKFLMVFIVSLTASWTIINFARKFKIVNQII
jgi:glucans biosynthesis protein C